MVEIKQTQADLAKKSRKGFGVSLVIMFVGVLVMCVAPFLESSLFLPMLYTGLFITASGGLSLFFIGGLADRSQRKKYAIGSVLIMSGLVLGTITLNVYMIQVSAGQQMLLILFSLGLLLVLPTLGMIVFLSGARRAFSIRLAPPPNILEAFRQIEPERIFEAKKCTVVKKGEVYAVIPKAFNAIYFIRFLTSTNETGNKMKLPKQIRWGRFRDAVDGFPVAKLEGKFSIPISATKTAEKSFQERYYKGKAVLFVMARREKVRTPIYFTPNTALVKDLSNKFNRDTANTLVEMVGRMPLQRS